MRCGWDGRYVVLGFAAGDIPCISLNLILLKGIRVIGFENRTIMDHLPDVVARDLSEVLQMLLGKEASYGAQFGS
ncbi:hypothetical protein KXD96_27060 [Mycobacterium sp. SMC-2]|uniref:hypothetical protein n=1 Tax=Mycobacterium TaxID=1763 RepID=UPI001CE19A02|nr:MULTISPECIES: hypothetical protein [Mycobacterium]MCA4759076.1 hypothetical protein [Mycobacterium avium subsp. hominissuis]UXA06453.1 hypothetical protein KXD96_27060 [Mycobacterium sp. SMC-2]